jgi:hypothetical protein
VKLNELYAASAYGQDAIFEKENRCYAKFALLGVVLDSTINNKGTSFKIAPEKYSWSRFIAIMGALFNQRTLYFSSFQRGINFSTRQLIGK